MTVPCQGIDSRVDIEPPCCAGGDVLVAADVVVLHAYASSTSQMLTVSRLQDSTLPLSTLSK